MNHVWPVALRSGEGCLRNAACPPPLTSPISFFSAFARRWIRPWTPSHSFGGRKQQTTNIQTRSLSYTARTEFAQSFNRQKLVAYKPTAKEQGLSFRKSDLPTRDIEAIFGQDAPPTSFLNQYLRVLHGRRVDGTLELPLPKEFEATLRRYPDAEEDGLRWLRQNYPIDEEAAVVQRIEREEAEQERQNPYHFLRQGEELGLYKPQSGIYQAPVSEIEGDVFGVSQIEKRQAENLKKAEQEEEELQQEIDKLQEEVQDNSGQLVVRPENSLEASDEVRPPNLYERWILRSKMRATSKLTLDTPEVSGKGPLRRLLPSFFFVAFITGLCYLYALTWIPPKRSERIFPDLGLAFATVGGIISANMFIYALWKFPPAWRILNRYFVTVPGIPVPISLLGNVFSHNSFRHLTFNMLWLLILGLSLHEDIGRGNFLATYIAGGAIGSFVSASSWVLRGFLFTSHMGASGAVCAVVAAYCTVHVTDRFTFFVVREDWQEILSFTGLQFLVFMLLSEGAKFASLRYSAKYKFTDFAAHFGGYAVGIIAGWWYRQDKEREQQRKNRGKLTWVDHLFQRKESDGRVWIAEK